MIRRARLLATAAALGVALLAWPASPAASTPATDGVTRVCRFSDARFDEISGLATSLRHPDVLWLHNDSGGGPFVYAVDATTCRTLATVRLAGVPARDIEAIAAGRDERGRPVLWVADIGDNLDSWPEVRLHRFVEPARLVDQTVAVRTFRFTYADRPHNAEALLVDPASSRMWVVTKQLAHGRIYRLPSPLSPTALNIARPVGRVGGLVTDAAMSPTGARFAIRDYWDARVYAGRPPGTLQQEIVLPPQPQGEAVTWTADGTALLVASEGDDRLMRVAVPWWARWS